MNLGKVAEGDCADDIIVRIKADAPRCFALTSPPARGGALDRVI